MELIPLKIKLDLEEFLAGESFISRMHDQGYILTRCMFDMLLNLATAEKSKVVLHAACGKEVEMITILQDLVL